MNLPPPFNPTKLLEIPSRDLQTKTIKIGISGNLGGHTRELCVGSVLAIEEWMEENPDHTVEIAWEEDVLDEKKAGKAARQLLAKGVDVVVGHLSSTEAIAASQIYYKSNIPYLAPATSNPNLTKNGYQNLLRFFGTDDELAEQMIQFTEQLNCRNTVIIWQPITYGRTLADLLEHQLNEKGLSSSLIVWNKEGVTIPPNTDVVLYAGTYQVGAQVLRFLQEIQYEGSVVMGDDAYISELSLLAGDAAEGVYVVSTYVNETHPDYALFYQRYVEKAGVPPGAYSVTSYVATQMLLKSFEMSSVQQVKTFMDTIRKNSMMDQTLLGNLLFNKNGDLLNFSWGVYEIHKGQFRSI